VPERAGRSGARAAGVLAAAFALAACGADPAVTRWSAAWKAAGQQVDSGDARAGLQALERLERDALTAADRSLARMDQARAYEKLGQPEAAFALYGVEGDRAVRRLDRARARHEQARLAESAGDGSGAVPLYRRIVMTYPDLMPGLRAAQRLQALAERGPPGSLSDHLRWSHQAYEVLQSYTLGDNLLAYAGHIAYRAWVAGGGASMAEAAEALYTKLARQHFLEGLWEEGVWELSWLYRRQGRFDEEQRAVQRILATRERSYLLGSYDTPYHWLGELRLARMDMMERGRPAAAARAYGAFLEHYPRSRWRDDVRFWQGCAWLRAGRTDEAERSFAGIAEEYDESKYLRRLDAARADPGGEVCAPRPIVEGMP
jgi:tetratricopeptide (TPR) repeat protein